eukprot:m.149934 g.149934  ORF g.149934 m.149934 type:complete len:106 (+) comp38537_c0_seq1:258-575(+)
MLCSDDSESGQLCVSSSGREFRIQYNEMRRSRALPSDFIDVIQNKQFYMDLPNELANCHHRKQNKEQLGEAQESLDARLQESPVQMSLEDEGVADLRNTKKGQET